MRNLSFGLVLCFGLSLFVKAQTTPSPSAIKQTHKKSLLTEKQRADFVSMGAIHRINVFKEDSMMTLTSDKYTDHRIFGYQQPNTMSKKMIVISIFTYDVKDNPYHCPYGAYYDINGSENLDIKYAGQAGDFIKAKVSVDKSYKGTIYISKRWIRFVKL